jgi:hypothetical protein
MDERLTKTNRDPSILTVWSGPYISAVQYQVRLSNSK